VSKSEVLLGRLPQKFTPAAATPNQCAADVAAGRKDKCSVAAIELDPGAAKSFPLAATAAFTTIASGANSAP